MTGKLVGKITLEGARPDTPRQKIEVMMAVAQAITDDPAEAVMVALCCALRTADTHSDKDRATRMAGLVETLSTWSREAVDNLWPEDERRTLQ